MSETDDRPGDDEPIGEELSAEELDKVRGGTVRVGSNDEVLVAFEHGDSGNPVIIGSLWNGKSKPPG